MTSKIGVKKIVYPNGNDVITIGATGALTVHSTDSSTFAGPIIGNNGITAKGPGGTNIGTAPLRILDENDQLATIGISNGGHLYFNLANDSSDFFFKTVLDNRVKLKVDYDGAIKIIGEGGSTGERIDLRQGSIKHWSSIQQGGTQTILDTYNCASATDDGTGRTTVTFTNNMNNSVYSATCTQKDGLGYNDDFGMHADNDDAYSTSQFGYYCHATSTPNDAGTAAWCQIAGDLA